MVSIILDASAFLSGKFTSLPRGYETVITTSYVEEEVRRGAPARSLENLLSAGLKVKDPASVGNAERAAERTGDIELLSKADISIIALALELENVLVVTDDFRVQNVLKDMGIRFEPAGELGGRTINDVWKWTYRCSGCGRYFDEPGKKDICPVCGSQVRKKKKR
ncbi:MAG: NOB1 family endonuclease [Thermoplasmatota archaeon]